MGKLKTFFRSALIGGVLVMLPVVIMAFVFRWIFVFFTDLIQPLTDYTQQHYGLPEFAADIVVLIVIIGVCFVIGTVVSTSIGKWVHNYFDKYLIKLAPGYRIVKEIIMQIFSDSADSPFSRGEVVRVRMFGENCETTVTGLVTARHADGTVTFFMPTGPNPTSGNIYHVPLKLVEFFPDASVEKMMKSIIACGAGSDLLFNNPIKKG